MNKKLTWMFSAMVLVFACKSDHKSSVQTDEEFSVKIRIAEEPPRLNPILSSSFFETQILNHLFLPLANYDPYTLEFNPVLLESIPNRTILDEGHQFANEALYSFKIKSDAKWSDGKPILAEDYLFSLKTILCPQLNSSSWVAYVTSILDIQLSDDDPKKFDVIVDKEYMLSLEAAAAVQLIPKHHYDPNGLLNEFEFQYLKTAADSVLVGNEDLVAFGESFASANYSRDNIVGSGPYQISQWETGQLIVLEKTEDWWGEQIVDNDLFSAHPQQLIYQIVADETAALTALKDDQIDVMTINDPQQFMDLKQDSIFKDKFHFLISRLPVYYYVGMNNLSPLLKDPRVRRAVAHTLDVDYIIDELMFGTATRTVGPINPGKPYYNKDLKPIDLNLERAKTLLKEAGWEDTNNNGIVDKNVNGQVEELTLRFFVTQQELGRKTALIHKNEALKAGIDIEIVAKPDFPTIRKDHLNKGNFELVAAGSRLSPADFDPYQSWHSDNFSIGTNFLGFSEADDLIEDIRSEDNLIERADLYEDFQELLYESQPAIFLFSPSSLIIVNNKFEAKVAQKRPGYFENLFKLAKAN